MTRRALLIGAQILGLEGVGNDLQAMSDELPSWDFEPRRLDGDGASRDGIIAAYRELIAETSDGDAALVYFSMHGGIVEQASPRVAPEELPAQYQFIVPFDFEESVDGDFRGITALELSALQNELTERTSNVTVILDCCFAGRMSRNPGLIPKALPRVQFADLTAHVQRAVDRGLVSGRRAPAGNQRAVRLVAAGPDESAYEYTVDGHDRRAGIFTEALCRALSGAREVPVSWSAFMSDLRRRVQTISPHQRPEVEGPSHRLIFSTDVAAADAVAVRIDGQRVSLAGGRLSDIDVGDRFAVMPAGSAAVRPDLQIAAAVVTAVTPARAEIRVEDLRGLAAVPPGAVAFPISRAQRRYPVAVTGDEPGADAVRTAVRTASHVREMQEGDTHPLATAHISNNAATLRDRTGDLTYPDAVAVDEVVPSLNRLARAATLRLVGSGKGMEELTDQHDVELLTTDAAGNSTPLAETEVATLFVGQRICIRLKNQGPSRLHFFVFDVGLGGKVTLLTNSDPSGIALNRGEEFVVGRDEQVLPIGLPLEWPKEVPETASRLESILVIVTSQRQDLGGLQQEGVATTRAGQRSSLEQLIDQFAAGTNRDLNPRPSALVRYAVHRYDLLVQPAPRPAERTRCPELGRPSPTSRTGDRR